jgi:hypothetical protein
MVSATRFLYSSTIDTGILKRDCKMNITLGLRALVLLAFVATATAAIVTPAMTGADAILGTAMVVSHP